MNAPVAIDDLIAYLHRQRLVAAVEVMACDHTMARSVYKIRCRLFPDAYQLHLRIIQTPTEVLYAYQVFTDHPIARWDNAPHFPDVSSFPHHFHDEHDRVHPSPLQGDVFADLEIVWSEVTAVIRRLEFPA